MQIVLGAGLGGLSLAVALVREGVTGPIVVVDRRTTFGHDRTWCTWAMPGVPFLELARHRWATWEVITPEGASRATSAAHPYVHIASEDFYSAALETLERAPNVELRLGETVLELGDGWARTERERLDGLVHDALALGSPALRGRRLEPLWQGFLGWEVEVPEPRFEPGVVTLMDFRTPQDGDLQFLYTLPFSPTRALVEHTSFAPRGPGAEIRRERLREYLGDCEILHEERGRLPMTTARLPALRSPRTAALGIAGGGMRASSGYAFSRVQAHATALARAVARGEPLPRRAGSRRRAALDAVFLRAMTNDPAAFPEHFRALVDRVPSAAYARFMADASSPPDEARVMAALPVLPFARASAQASLRRLREDGGHEPS